MSNSEVKITLKHREDNLFVGLANSSRVRNDFAVSVLYYSYSPALRSLNFSIIPFEEYSNDLIS